MDPPRATERRAGAGEDGIAGFGEVLARAQRGEASAVEVLYRAYHPRLIRFLRGRDLDAADDLAGEVWLAVAQQLSGFRGDEAGFRSWLFTIARRRLVDHGRRVARRRTDSTATETLARLEDRRSGPAELVAAALDSRTAIELLSSHLSDDQAEVLLLRIVGGLGVDEVAAMLGRSGTWVRVTQHRAIRRLGRRVVFEDRVTR